MSKRKNNLARITCRLRYAADELLPARSKHHPRPAPNTTPDLPKGPQGSLTVIQTEKIRGFVIQVPLAQQQTAPLREKHHFED